MAMKGKIMIGLGITLACLSIFSAAITRLSKEKEEYELICWHIAVTPEGYALPVERELKPSDDPQQLAYRRIDIKIPPTIDPEIARSDIDFLDMLQSFNEGVSFQLLNKVALKIPIGEAKSGTSGSELLKEITSLSRSKAVELVNGEEGRREIEKHGPVTMEFEAHLEGENEDGEVKMEISVLTWGVIRREDRWSPWSGEKWSRLSMKPGEIAMLWSAGPGYRISTKISPSGEAIRFITVEPQRIGILTLLKGGD